MRRRNLLGGEGVLTLSSTGETITFVGGQSTSVVCKYNGNNLETAPSISYSTSSRDMVVSTAWTESSSTVTFKTSMNPYLTYNRNVTFTITYKGQQQTFRIHQTHGNTVSLSSTGATVDASKGSKQIYPLIDGYKVSNDLQFDAPLSITSYESPITSCFKSKYYINIYWQAATESKTGKAYMDYDGTTLTYTLSQVV